MNQDVLDRVLKSPELPSLPTIALEVIELVKRQDVDIRQIARTISHDPALTSKILRTVNSSFYGQTKTISTISQALVVLGLNTIKTLALGFSLVNTLPKSPEEDNGFDHLIFWKRSLYGAVAARALAQRIGLAQQEEAFLGGLLQDVGLLAMSQVLGDDYLDLVDDAEDDHQRLVAMERAELQTDHAEIGAQIAETWKLPPMLIAPIRYHEDPTGAPQELRDLVRTVALGNCAAAVFIMESAGAALERYYALSADWFDIPREEAEPLLSRVHKNTEEMRRLFCLPTGALGDPSKILATAHEALFNLTLQQTQQTQTLERQNASLRERATKDALTGLANRGQFDEFIQDAFERTRKGEAGPVSLLFLDTDHFKRFNDTYGHQTGDRVLMEQATVLSREAPDGALVARYGGEEFAVIVPETGRVAAARLAEQVRRAIVEMAVVSDDGQELTITASIGVATFDGSVFQSPDQLIKAADQGVYVAKSAGRNCVRVFTPRKPAAA